MIILMLLNFVAQVENFLLLHIFQFTVPTLNSLTTWITGLSVPQTLLDILSVTVCFLPMGTISILLGFTLILITFKVIVSLLHFVTLGILWKS